MTVFNRIKALWQVHREKFYPNLLIFLPRNACILFPSVIRHAVSIEGGTGGIICFQTISYICCRFFPMIPISVLKRSCGTGLLYRDGCDMLLFFTDHLHSNSWNKLIFPWWHIVRIRYHDFHTHHLSSYVVTAVLLRILSIFHLAKIT